MVVLLIILIHFYYDTLSLVNTKVLARLSIVGRGGCYKPTNVLTDASN